MLHRNSDKPKGRFFMLRQILNLLFMIIAVVGVVMYLCYDQTKGTIVVIIAMAFKMSESVLRYIK